MPREHKPPSRLPLIDPELLRSFVAIADSGSFTQAAREMFRTPSAISMQIKRLEHLLGNPLFSRNSRQIRLTPEGELLLHHGRRLLQLHEETVAQFLSPPLAGTVAFGTSDDIGARILPCVLAQFSHSHPAVQVDVTVGLSAEMARRVDAGELDLALITGGQDAQIEARGEVVHTEPLVWAAREGGVAQHRSPLPLSLANAGCAWRRLALDALDRSGIAYRVAYTSDACAAQEAAVLSDLAIAPLPLSLLRPPLKRLPDDAGLPSIGMHHVVLLRGAGLSDAGAALAAHVVEALRGTAAPRSKA